MNISTPIQWVSIVLAGVLIWLAVFSLSYHTFAVTAPVTFTGLDQKLAINNDNINLEIVVRAKQLVYYKIRKGDVFKVTANLAHIKEVGNHSVKPNISIEARDVWAVSTAPNLLELEIVPAITKELPIIVDIVGVPKVGFAVEKITLVPEKVLAIGPENVIKNQSAVYLIVDVEKRSGNFSTTGTPKARKADGTFYQNISVRPRVVNIDVRINKGETFKTVGVVPQFEGSLPPGYWIREVVFSESAITLKSSAHRLIDIASVSTTPIKLDNHTKDFTDQVGLETPSGVQVTGNNLISVTVKIGVSEYNRQLIIAPQAVNIPPTLKLLRIAPATVTITLTGPPNVLAEVLSTDIDLRVDVSKATSGLTNFKISEAMFVLPEEIELLSFVPESLNFSFTKK